MVNNVETPFMHTTVETKIVDVTVYTDQALVTRRGMVSLTGQEQELLIPLLPVTLETESVRVRGTGNVGVRLVGVSTEHIFSTEPIAERIAHLTKQIQQLEAEWNHLQAQVDGLALQSRFIEGLRQKTEEPFAQSLSRRNLSLSETLDFVNFLGSQCSEYVIATFEYKTQQQEVDKQLQVLRASLQKIQTPSSKESYSLIVTVEPESALEFELEISYIVNHARWTPLYDLRVISENDTVNLGYLGEITQNTGEDWIGVTLTLSTAKPGLGTLPPKLQPWYIDVPKPPEFYRRMRRRVQLPEETMPSAPLGEAMRSAFLEENTSLEEENTIAAQSVEAEVSQEGSIVNFTLSILVNIASDGTPHKTTILNDDYPCNLEYIAMPRLVSFAYLQANVKNSGNAVTLLPGKANVFRDNIFVGTTTLDNVTPGEEFKLNLGIDEGLKIERDLVERQVDKKLIGNSRRITYGYRVEITNLLNTEASITVTEQLPVSRNEQIKVRLTRSNPQIQLGEMGILEWELTLPPQRKQEIYYQFSVEHPPELTVVGLDV